MKESKKEMYQLLRNIVEGDYKKADDNVSTIIEHILTERISKINKNLNT
jgi:hypothetical protein